LGYARNLFGIWIAFLAPAGVPAEVVNVLVPAIERAVKSPGAAARLTRLGIVQDYAPPDGLLAEIREESKRVLEMAAKGGLVQ
jgi:tripartite-type tricarboxylate transporter receptor subunit TctC